MIERQNYEDFSKELQKKTKGLRPVSAQIELTYACNLDCIHCYCKDTSEGKELETQQWISIIDQLYDLGCLYLTLTGGEPLLRKDFFKIYDHAKRKGFFVSVFSNGLLFDDKVIEAFVKEPPFSIEITLNGITEEVYDAIAGCNGMFDKVISNIKKIKEANLPLILKAIGLKENKHEIFKIKSFSENLLGKKKFKFDSFIVPKLNGDNTPCKHRLSVDEIEQLENQDPEMVEQREKEFSKHQSFMRDHKYKYHCNAWFNQVYITPYGQLRFCHITEKYSSDLTKISVDQGIFLKFPEILEETHQHPTQCMSCDLREYCHHCPARAFLETGDEDGVVEYYCELARKRKQRIESFKNNGKEK